MGGRPPNAHHSVEAAGQAAVSVATSVGFIHSFNPHQLGVWGREPTWEHLLCREGRPPKHSNPSIHARPYLLAGQRKAL